METRRLASHDTDAYQRVHLRALGDHPEAFGMSVEEAQARTSEQVAQQLDDPTGNNPTFGTLLNSRLVGIVNLFRFPRPKTRHKAMMGGMYVVPEARRKGIAKTLLEATLIHARQMDGLEDITLAVTVGNVSARQLYVDAGFVPYGVEPRYIKLDNQYFDIEWMILHLKHR